MKTLETAKILRDLRFVPLLFLLCAATSTLSLCLPGKSQALVYTTIGIAVAGMVMGFSCLKEMSAHLSAIGTRIGKLFRVAVSLCESFDSTVRLVPQEATAVTSDHYKIDENISLFDMLNLVDGHLVEAARNSRAVIENSIDVICTIDAAYRFVSINPASERVLGYTPEELIGRSFTEFLVALDVERSLMTMGGCNISMNRVSVENQWRQKNDEIIDLLWSVHWSLEAKTMFCIMHDITPRKNAERLLKASEDRLRKILDGLPVGVLQTSSNGSISYANPSVEYMTGYPRETLEGRSAVRLFSIPQEWNKSFDTKLGRDFESYLVKENGETFPAEVKIIPTAMDGSGLIVIADISERKRIEQLKREMVAMITHELRTPLTSIKTVLSLTAEGAFGDFSETGGQFFTRADKELSRLNDLVQNILDLEKMHSGTFEVTLGRTCLNDVIKSSVEVLSPLADSRHIRVETRITPDVYACADGVRILQVLINLLSNAIKFSPDQALINITVETDSDWTRVSVQDSGRGVPADHLDLIFEKFHQVEASDNHHRGGTGLGLPICKSIVEKHGGTIGVDSQHGQGSTFWFTLRTSSASVEINEKEKWEE